MATGSSGVQVGKMQNSGFHFFPDDIADFKPRGTRISVTTRSSSGLVGSLNVSDLSIQHDVEETRVDSGDRL